MWFSRKQLERDLARWHEAGWVTADGLRAISAEIQGPPRQSRFAAVLATIAAVLLGFAAMTFVAANWDSMSRLARLGLLLTGLWISYGAAAVLIERQLHAFAHAAVLAGVGLFGAGIMLVAQMYHLDGNPPDAVLLWAAGTLAAGLAFRSNAALALALILVVVWSSWETARIGAVHFGFVPAWLIVTAALWRQNWAPGLHLAALALAIWVVMLGYLIAGLPHALVATVGIAVAVGAMAAGRVELITGRRALAAFGYGAAVAYAGLFALQFFEDRSGWAQTGLAVLTLALLLGALAWGARTNHRGILWIAYSAFSVEVLGLYGKTLGSLIGTSLFFLVAGVLAMALAVLAWWLNARASERAGRI
ncbi:MAG: DUF2157 domain-containing protein [Hyphomicrobiaceae bacterium]